MNNIRKGLALALVLIFLFPLVALQPNNVKAASDSGLPGWMNFGADSNNTFSYNVLSQWAGSPSVPFTTLWSQSSQASFVLTGDLLGTGQLEVVVSSSPNLNVYDADGNLVWTVNPVNDSSFTGAVLGGITLANINGAMVVLATISSGTQNSNGALAILIYSGKGSLLKEIQGPNAWAFDQVRLADLNGNGNYEVIATVYSGYTLSPRGVYAYSYDTGSLLWTYQMGPTPHLDALADLTHTGKLDIVISTFAPCNGYSQGTTNDFSIYEIALSPDGQVLWNTCLGTGGQQSVRSAIVDFGGNGDLKVVAFVRSDPVVDPEGPNNIYVLNGATGNIEDTHLGIVGDSWHGFSISTSLSGTPIIFADTESGKIYGYDSKLNVISQTNIGGTPVPLIYGHINGEENNDGSTMTSANLYSDGNTQVAILVNRPDGTQQVSVFEASSIGGNTFLAPLWSQNLPLTTSNNYYTMVFVSNLGNGFNDIILAGSPGLLVLGPSNADSVPASSPTPISSPNVGAPVISSVTQILANRLQNIDIHGSAFGKTQPQLMHLGDGSVDTVGGGTTPVLRIYDEGNSNSWEAGVQDTSNTGADSIGLILVSWSDTDIVLGGFGTELSTNGTGQWNLSPGDPLLISVLTNNGQAVYTAFAGSTQSNQNSPIPTGAQPIISSVSQIAAVRLQTIVIYGSGFGSISPQLMNLSDGSQDTVIGGATPVLRIYDEAGVDSWEAGCTDSQWVPKDSVGIYLISWSDSQIILRRFRNRVKR